MRDNTTRLFAAVSLGLGIFLLLPNYQLSISEHYDRLMFRLWSHVMSPAEQLVSDQLTLVHLPDSFSGQQRPSAQSTAALNRILKTLGEQNAAAIGVTADLDHLLWTASDVVAMLAPQNHKQHKTAQQQLAPYHHLSQTLEELSVTWTFRPSRYPQERALIDREFRWPLFSPAHDLLMNHYYPPAQGRPVMADSILLAQREGDAVWQAGPELSLLALRERAPAIRWLIPTELIIGERHLPISSFGGIRAWPQGQAMATLKAQALQPADLNIDLSGTIALLGFSNHPALAESASRLNALLTRQYSYAPWWQWPASAMLVSTLWLAGIVALRRLSAANLMLISPLVIFVPGACSVVFQNIWGVWFDAGDTASFIIGLTLLLLVFRVVRTQHLRMRLEADDARLELAELHLASSNPNAAINQLQQTTMTRNAAELMMETGRSFERQRDFQAAQHAYRTVHQYFPSHQQASTALLQFQQQETQTPTLSSTLALANGPPTLKKLGRYQVKKQLGRGAMGVVYLARDPKIRRDVAIKTLPLSSIEESGADLRERFFREAEAAGKLDHPNIVSVYDVGEESGLAYIAMDYVPGGTLADWVHVDHLLELETLYLLMEATAQALAYAHKQGVVHRDIKPGNLLYNPEDGTIKITDFGIARLADYSRTKTGTILGSPYYMSPEQVSGQQVGPASDIYSLGVSFYQLACGGLPFEADSLAQLAWQITNKPHRNLGRFRKGLPRSASRIINTALQKSPKERFAKATDMADTFARGARSLRHTG